MARTRYRSNERSLRNKLLTQVEALMRYSIDDLLHNRYQRLMSYGQPG